MYHSTTTLDEDDVHPSQPRRSSVDGENFESMGKYTIGTFIGEEWIYYKRYTERGETCVAKEESCVLELSVDAFETIRRILAAN